MSEIRDFIIKNGFLKKYVGPSGDVVIPDGVVKIGTFAFWNCTNITRVTIPNSVISIEKCAFSGCTRLTNITISNSVTHINHYAFYNCHKLTINAPAGSYAEKFAKKKNISFIVEE